MFQPVLPPSCQLHLTLAYTRLSDAENAACTYKLVPRVCIFSLQCKAKSDAPPKKRTTLPAASKMTSLLIYLLSFGKRSMRTLGKRLTRCPKRSCSRSTWCKSTTCRCKTLLILGSRLSFLGLAEFPVLIKDLFTLGEDASAEGKYRARSFVLFVLFLCFVSFVLFVLFLLRSLRVLRFTAASRGGRSGRAAARRAKRRKASGAPSRASLSERVERLGPPR